MLHEGRPAAPEKADSQGMIVIGMRCMRVAHMIVIETCRMKAVPQSEKTAVGKCPAVIETRSMKVARMTVMGRAV